MPAHWVARLQWFLARSGWNHADWGRIVSSDESRFQPCPDDNQRRVWRHPGQRNVDDLARQLAQIMQEIPQENIRVLYHIMTRRGTACIQAEGWSTPY
ncbi:hypothetical protein TNCV_3736901 [Trichonephila clavipes]|nr:hypothetical protein TNCV_3736901 [Trichonephila clavipes]